MDGPREVTRLEARLARAGQAMLGKISGDDAAAMPPTITVCMVADDREAIIAEVIWDCLRTLDNIPGRHSILVVNDGSTDRTGKILYALASREPRLRVLTHRKKRGIPAAVRWLFREAPGDLIFYTVPDGAWRARDLYGLLKKLADGYDVVVGVRRSRHYSVCRLAVGWLYNFVVRLLFGGDFGDIGNITLARSEVWNRARARSNSEFFFAEMLVLAARAGARIGFAPVEHVKRSTPAAKPENPWRALEMVAVLFAFWLSPLSRGTIGLPGGGRLPRGLTPPLDQSSF